MTRIAGATSAHGASFPRICARERLRRRRYVPAAAPELPGRSSLDIRLASFRTTPYADALSVVVIWLLAAIAASLTDFLPVTIWDSMFWSTLPLSIFAQFFAVGTNHVTRAACASCLPGVPLPRWRRELVFG